MRQGVGGLKEARQLLGSCALFAGLSVDERALRIINNEVKSGGAKQARIHFSQRELANMLGGTRESVNKCLRNWQRDGFIQILEGSIVVTNQLALENLAKLTS